MKLAIFKNIGANYESVCGETFLHIAGWIQMSEFVEVEFPPLPVAVEKELDALEEKRMEIVRRAAVETNRINDRIAEIRATQEQAA